MLHQRQSQTGGYLFLQIWSLASKKNGVKEGERERGREGGEDCGRRAKERHPLHIHQSLFHLVAYLSAAPAERTEPRHSRRQGRPRPSVRQPGRYQYGQSATWYVNKHDQ